MLEMIIKAQSKTSNKLELNIVFLLLSVKVEYLWGIIVPLRGDRQVMR